MSKGYNLSSLDETYKINTYSLQGWKSVWLSEPKLNLTTDQLIETQPDPNNLHYLTDVDPVRPKPTSKTDSA